MDAHNFGPLHVIESFQSSNLRVPDSIRSSIGSPEPISKNAPNCVITPGAAEPLATLPLSHCVFNDRALSLSFKRSKDWDPYLDVSIFFLQVRCEVKEFGNRIGRKVEGLKL
ncbi:hypothetical protein M9H77_04576 [Catharanthus roseus]|uniref:Uncharacterized protein n=1 Tax=Catharanthus roseus TaxID=4058 RepID=A0ACC0CEE9_CATRO|nr:hypothetical protein M9H77_04576 [Catharanthus roseus]